MARKNNQVRLKDKEANKLGIEINSSKKYRLSDEHKVKLNDLRGVQEIEETTTTKPNDYKEKPLILSAWGSDGQMMDIDSYCDAYGLPRADISSYKLVSHTGTPFYNIVFKEQFNVESVDFESILDKYKNFEIREYVPAPIIEISNFDTLTYTDVHIGMETNADNNSMYADEWNEEEVIKSLGIMTDQVIRKQSSRTLVIDELGDFLDGLNGYTTRGGHKLPQNMTDEECFDLALSFKVRVINDLHLRYSNIIVNNICNDNHAGSFGYFVNSAAKRIIENLYDNVTVNNYRQFINHYYVGDICFLITHGKDDKTLKFGFKPQLDSKGLEKIDQYCKQNDIYKNAKKIVFKKGDSHQALFDMCTSDDFYYFNYPALSPSSQWVQNNFKKGRRGFVLETWRDLDVTIKPIFL